MSYQLPAALRRQDVFGSTANGNPSLVAVSNSDAAFDSTDFPRDGEGNSSLFSEATPQAERRVVELENEVMLKLAEKAATSRRVDPQQLINRFTPNFLAAPVGVKPLAEVQFAPRDRTLVYQPKILENTADNPADYPPLLSNMKRVVALDGEAKERSYPVKRFAQASGTTAMRAPSYVPFAVRKLGHDEVRWQPPPPERTVNDTQMSVATVVESAIPPTTRRNVNEEYALRKKLVAYDDSEAFGFVPRPIDFIHVLDQLLDDFFAAQERGQVPIESKPQMVVHGMKIFCFHASLEGAAWFQPSSAVRGTPSGGWQLRHFEDASRFVYSAIPPSSSIIVPIPNQPYMVTVSPKTLFLLDVEEDCWHALPIVGLHDFGSLSLLHMIDDKTLYVLSGSRKMHGLIKLEEPVQEVEIMKRGGSSKLFDPEFQTPVQVTRLRSTPCQEPLVPFQNVPGLAYCSAKGEGHTWLFYFNTVAKNFIPWERIDCETFHYVALKDHLDLDTWTVLFFSERLVRVDLGKEVPEKLQPGGGASRNVVGTKALSSSTQRVLKATHRLVITNPKRAVDAAADAAAAPPSSAAKANAEATGSGGSFAPTTSRVIRVSPFVPLGATDANFASRMHLGPVLEKDSTVVMKLRLSEVTLLCPMFDRCVAVVSYDKKAFVPIEVDRRLYVRRLAGDDIDALDTLDPTRL